MSDFMSRLFQFLAEERGSEVVTETFCISHSQQGSAVIYSTAIELRCPLQSAAERIIGYHKVSGDSTDHGHQQGPQLQHEPQTQSWSLRQHSGIYVSGLEKNYNSGC